MHQNYCLIPLSAIRKYYKAKPISSLTFHGKLRQIIRGTPACCSATHDVDMQRSDSHTGALMHQNHTRNRADSRAFEDKKLILVMLERALSFPIMFILPFSPSSRRIHAEPQARGLLDQAPTAYGCSSCRQPRRATWHFRPTLGKTAGTKGPDLDAETCPSSLGLYTPRPRQA